MFEVDGWKKGGIAPVSTSPFSLSPKYAESGNSISEQAAQYIQSLRRKRKEIKLERDALLYPASTRIQDKFQSAMAVTPGENVISPALTLRSHQGQSNAMELFMRTETHSEDLREDKDQKIARLEDTLERERDVCAAMKLELMEVQNYKQLLEGELHKKSQGFATSQKTLSESMRAATAKLSGLASMEDEAMKMKNEIKDKDSVIKSLHDQLNAASTENGAILGKAQVESLTQLERVRALEKETQILRRELKQSAKEVEKARKNANNYKEKLRECKEAIVSLRQAVTEIHNQAEGKRDSKTDDGEKEKLAARVSMLEKDNKSYINTISELEREQLGLLEAAERDAFTIQELYDEISQRR